jgi:hypothetical protein
MEITTDLEQQNLLFKVFEWSESSDEEDSRILKEFRARNSNKTYRA